MGRGFVEYQLPESGRSEFVTYSAFLDYRLPDGTTLSIDQQPAWCPACRAFALAERLPDLKELHRSQLAVQSGDPERLRLLQFVGRAAWEEVEDIRRRIMWRLGRRSPPRCLHCGCDEVVPASPGEEFRHPDTYERVVVAASGFASMDRWVAEFTPEGEAIPGADGAAS